MRFATRALFALLVAIPLAALADPPLGPALAVQQAGTTVVPNTHIENFVSGCTVTQSGSIANVTCNGSGGTITGSGTANTVAKFTGASAIGNSSITDDGANVTMAEPVGLANSATAINTASFSAQLQSGVANSGSNVAYIFDTKNSLTGSTAIFSLRNNTSEKFKVDNIGQVTIPDNSAIQGVSGANLSFNGSTTVRIKTSIVPLTDVTGTSGSSSARWDQSWVRARFGVSQSPTFSATMNVNPALGEQILIDMTASLTNWTISGGTGPEQFVTLCFFQDGAGSNTIGTPPASIKWAASTYHGTDHPAPTLTTTAGKTDCFYLEWNSLVTPTSNGWVEVARSMNLS